MAADTDNAIGDRIRRYRQEAAISLSELASKAGVSKGYLSNLENGRHRTRPSGNTLYAIAEALGVTMSDLLGRKLLSAVTTEVPDSLRRFADEAHLPESDVAMLAGIEFRGDKPRTRERWEYIYNAIKTSRELDRPVPGPKTAPESGQERRRDPRR
jgi:transcriptional regulator with XRE-family HTH domain